MNIASNVIAKCGGAVRTAEIVGVKPPTVYRWTYPKERGGTGGLVPAKYQTTLLAAVPSLSPSDFFVEAA
jgi:hypothetical protein